VGGATGAVDALEGIYHRLGIKDVGMKLYEGAHHEILNETNREEVMADIIAWLDARHAKAK
jgi:alpha-beta hydrolase superfamily lysophospholipase